jgi:hypothetical protein
MNDDDDVEYELSDESAQEIINWAVDVAATITLMFHEVPVETPEESLLKLQRFEEIIARIYEEMPDELADPAHELAVSAIERAEFEEEQVEEFLEQIKDL